MDITTATTAALTILGSIRGLFSRSKNLQHRSARENVDQEINSSGNGNQMIQARGNSTVTVHQSSSETPDSSPLPKGAACPHLKPEFIGTGGYRAVGFWIRAKGYAEMGVEDGKLAGSRECGFDCGELVGGVLPDCVYKECERSINAYCTDGDPLQPSKELMDFWCSRKLLH